jgi:hypothetical protein
MLPVDPPAQAGLVELVVSVIGAIVKLKQVGGATFPHRSVTDADALTRQREKLPLVRMAGEMFTVTVLPYVPPLAQPADDQPVMV